MRRFVLGIDLGTTNTLCAFWVEGEPAPFIIPIEQPTTDLTSFEGRSPLPSAVLIQPDAVYVGEYPKDLFRLGKQENVITSIKRHMGTPWVREDGRRSWTAEQISGCILLAVKQGVNLPADAPAPERVVITVPASFDIEQRRATLRAARLAGFDPKRTDLFDEPTAALLHYTRHKFGKDNQDSWSEARRLMVVDVGGGTLDVSCLTLHRKSGVLIADVIGRSRFNELAGDDFDLNLAGLLLERFQNRLKVKLEQLDVERRRQVCAGLVAHAESAKKSLCERAWGKTQEEQGKLDCEIEIMANTDLRWKTRVTMKDLQDALIPFFLRPRDAAARLSGFSFFTAIEECMDSLRRPDVTDPDKPPDHVFLAGGSANLPFIKQVIKKHFQDVAPQHPAVEAQVVDRPMDAIALGAAWYAGSRAGFHDAGEVKLIQHMHEGIYLLTRRGEAEELVSPSEQLPVKERSVTYEVGAGISDRLEIDLITGIGEKDVRMRPLAHLLVPLDGFVSPGVPIRLLVSVDDNRDFHLGCEATVDGAVIQGRVQIYNGYEWRGANDDGPRLPMVNPLPKGARP
jgi:molecular chaperone DnaK